MSHIVHTLDRSLLEELTALLAGGENVTTLWLPGGGRTRFGLELQNSDPLSEFFPDKNNKIPIIFIYLDYTLDHIAIESQLKDVLSDHSNETRKREMVRDVLAKGYRIVLVLDNYTYLRPETSQFLFSIRSIDIDAITFLIFQLESDFAQSTQTVPSLESSTHAFHNVIRMPYMRPETARIWIVERARSLDLTATDRLVDEVFSFGGGIPVLLKKRSAWTETL
ncbi:MAG: hypothetical protein TR69_WS6001000316 [candidate division WS6 bacterium OLB20]|uniref:Uncharacterized protein n=1 Tax=candidate division WS6 bacterium OLB20 TaxID=1617426 RepID=A0A136M0K4_9BACT|nr:MAG: hypothetical protein TR69_WS6001000316 [candidate division WS6 bacterium OLB20]